MRLVLQFFMLLYKLCAMFVFDAVMIYFEQPGTSTCCMVKIPVNNTSVTICVATELLSTSCIKHDVTIPVNNTSVTICTSTGLLR